MKEYHKIQTVFKRDENTHKIIVGSYSTPAFEYLTDNEWVFTEKVDGTNIRVNWDGGKVTFRGRTDNAQTPVPLLEKLSELFPASKFKHLPALTLYGEGYGAKIQKGGGNYIRDGVDFILFDILIDEWWLESDNVEDISMQLDIPTVPVLGYGTISKAVEMVQKGFDSVWGNFPAEGLVLKPKTGLVARNGHRIITKIKHKDF